MKKTLLAALLLVGLMSANVASAGAPYYWNFSINDENGDAQPVEVEPQAQNDNTPRILISKGGEGIPHHPLIASTGVGLVWTNNRLDVGLIGQDQVYGLEADIANLHTELGGKANTSHTHVTGDITGLQSYVDGRIAATPTTLTFGTTTRSLNTAFQISTTKAAMVSYTVDIGATLSLLAGQTGTVTLQYADDSAFTTNVKTVQSSANGNTGALTIGLNLTQTSTASLTGIIPAGKWVKIVTANTTGTPTFTYRTQQEVILPMN